jgi:hypothetical protein
MTEQFILLLSIRKFLFMLELFSQLKTKEIPIRLPSARQQTKRADAATASWEKNLYAVINLVDFLRFLSTQNVHGHVTVDFIRIEKSVFIQNKHNDCYISVAASLLWTPGSFHPNSVY